MLFKFTAKLKKGADIKRIEALEAKLADTAALNKYVGMGFARTLQKHFKALDKRPNKRGWRRLGFWRGIAAATSFLSADEKGATVSISGTEGPKFAAKVFGATVKPKGGKKFLAIPAIEARYGVMPSTLPEGELEFKRTRKGGLLGKIRADGSMTVHYWLVKSATIPRDANALPTTETVRKDAEKAINTYLKKR